MRARSRWSSSRSSALMPVLVGGLGRASGNLDGPSGVVGHQPRSHLAERQTIELQLPHERILEWRRGAQGRTRQIHDRQAKATFWLGLRFQVELELGFEDELRLGDRRGLVFDQRRGGGLDWVPRLDRGRVDGPGRVLAIDRGVDHGFDSGLAFDHGRVDGFDGIQRGHGRVPVGLGVDCTVAACGNGQARLAG
jgi:hypothetical protein